MQRFRQKNRNKTIREAAEQAGIPYTSLRDRLKLDNCPTPHHKNKTCDTILTTDEKKNRDDGE
jgi:hypothetical protein